MAAGSDVAMQAADVTLMRDDLGSGRRHFTVAGDAGKIRQNFSSPSSTTCSAFRSAALGMLNPVIARRRHGGELGLGGQQFLLLRNWKPGKGWKMETTTIKVDGMSCGGCVKSVTGVLTALDGVAKAEVSAGAEAGRGRVRRRQSEPRSAQGRDRDAGSRRVEPGRRWLTAIPRHWSIDGWVFERDTKHPSRLQFRLPLAALSCKQRRSACNERPRYQLCAVVTFEKTQHPGGLFRTSIRCVSRSAVGWSLALSTSGNSLRRARRGFLRGDQVAHHHRPGLPVDLP